MYSIKQLTAGVRDPRKVVFELNRLFAAVRGRRPIHVMAEDWDNLIILDACRYDLFDEVNHIGGQLSAVISGGSSTSGFLQHNFGGEVYDDSVYVTANPQVTRHKIGRRFVHCTRLWEEFWDDELRTVLPDAVTDNAITVNEMYPHKRMIIHYIQPHYPFIGDIGQEVEHGEVTGDGVITRERKFPSAWEQLRRGSVTRQWVQEAYKENLEIVLPQVERLINLLDGKSVITSDHGNSFGKMGVFGHPGGIYLNSLVTVPWLEIDAVDRRQIVPGVVDTTSSAESGAIERRLASLGYK